MRAERSSSGGCRRAGFGCDGASRRSPLASEPAAEIEVAPRSHFAERRPAHATPATPATPAEFEISLMAIDSDEPAAEVLQAPVESILSRASGGSRSRSDHARPARGMAPAAAQASGEEVDLSDEWEAMAQEVAEPPASAAEEVAPSPPLAPEEPTPVEVAEAGEERIEIELPAEIERQRRRSRPRFRFWRFKMRRPSRRRKNPRSKLSKRPRLSRRKRLPLNRLRTAAPILNWNLAAIPQEPPASTAPKRPRIFSASSQRKWKTWKRRRRRGRKLRLLRPTARLRRPNPRRCRHLRHPLNTL